MSRHELRRTRIPDNPRPVRRLLQALDPETHRDAIAFRRPYWSSLMIPGCLLVPVGLLLALASTGPRRDLDPDRTLFLVAVGVLVIAAVLLRAWWVLAARRATRNGDRVRGPYDH